MQEAEEQNTVETFLVPTLPTEPNQPQTFQQALFRVILNLIYIRDHLVIRQVFTPATIEIFNKAYKSIRDLVATIHPLYQLPNPTPQYHPNAWLWALNVEYTGQIHEILNPEHWTSPAFPHTVDSAVRTLDLIRETITNEQTQSGARTPTQAEY